MALRLPRLRLETVQSHPRSALGALPPNIGIGVRACRNAFVSFPE